MGSAEVKIAKRENLSGGIRHQSGGRRRRNQGQTLWKWTPSAVEVPCQSRADQKLLVSKGDAIRWISHSHRQRKQPNPIPA